MKSLIRILFFAAIFLAVGFYVSHNEAPEKDTLIREEPVPEPADQSKLEKRTGYEIPPRPKTGLSTLIGKSAKAVEKVLGKPNRIDKSSYDYDWHIYNGNLDNYLQAGIEDGKVVTVFAIGSDTDVSPFIIGQPLEEIFAAFAIQTDIIIDFDGNSYRLELTDTDVNTRPLIQFGDIYAQLYIDKFTSTLSSIRFLNAETLIKQRPYEVAYRGQLIESKPLEEEEWKKVEAGNEQQVFDLTNVLRLRFELEPLQWDERTAQVAYGHSLDMYETNTFSHESEKYGKLTDRLKQAKVVYQTAGENIAANYTDSPAAVEGWLNSKGHREALLNEEFTHLGVGVHRKYYTQNFIQKWLE
ncbi:CAP domain-containing protein [Bacillus sp. FJAT-18017]|uniref:CAP domain-containing protein n=1 Tax=Bacillus sp. FJAT-18017 TaxID=1705566 RepID=UPI003FA413B7